MLDIKQEQFDEMMYNDFCRISDLLINFMKEFTYEELWVEISREMHNTLGKCNDISFDNYGVALSYIIWHFLDRYHRFQLIYKELLNNGLLCRKRNVDVLDVGAGPAQALFALNDYYNSLKIFRSKDYKYKLDYVERSKGFRHFLHGFCEFALSQSHGYEVPFHHGTFDDFTAIRFDKEFIEFDYEADIEYRNRKILKHRYDIAILSNFLTTKKIVESHHKDFLELQRSLRNHALIIVVGAVSDKGEYKTIYGDWDKLFNRRFNDRRFKGYYSSVMPAKIFEWDYKDRYGIVLKEFFQEIKLVMTNNGSYMKIPQKERKIIEDFIFNKKNTINKWEVRVYKKRSFYKGKY